MGNSAEAKKFETLFRKVQRDIRKLAASSDGQYGPMNKTIVRSIERLYDLSRIEEYATTYEQNGGLIAARRFAAAESGENLKQARYAEIARLNAVIREKRIEARINNGW
jgi:hypothetical protein